MESVVRDKAREAEESLRKRFKKTIWSRFTRAINDYELMRPGDRVAVCISGGKDSMLMAKCFQELKLHNKFEFGVEFLVMDPGYSPQNRRRIEENAAALHVPLTIFETDIFDSVFHVEKSPCYLCARMRRGHLYSKAREMGCNKIALGHHYDDVIETILMGMLYGGQVQTMMPKLHSTNFQGMELIRPMYLIRERHIKAWRDCNDLHFLQCACHFTEESAAHGLEGNISKRAEVKELIARLGQTNPFVEGNIFKSVENVNLDTVVGYKRHGRRHHFLDSYGQEQNIRQEEKQMNTMEAIRNRKSIRSYTGESVTPEEMERILEAANAAPIGRAEYDTVHLTVIKKPSLLEKIDRACAEMFGNPDMHPLYGAPLFIVVSAKQPQPGFENLTYSNAAIVAHNMAIAATELGVGTCHIWGAISAVRMSPELTGELQLPEGFIPCCALTLGKTKETYVRREIPMDRISQNVVE